MLKLYPSQHAIKAMRDDRYGKFSIPVAIDTNSAEAIEAEVVGGEVVKVLYRIPLNRQNDVCIAVIPQNGVVKTAWLNRIDDKHKTLNVSKYKKG